MRPAGDYFLFLLISFGLLSGHVGRSSHATEPLLLKPGGGPFLDGRLPTNAPVIPSDFEVRVAFPNLTFQNPMGIVSVPGSTRLAVWEREGQIWTFENDPATTNKTLILDLSIQCQGWGASGVFSAAFHPGFSTNRWLFVYYTWVQPGTVLGDIATESPEYSPGNYRDRLSRFTLAGNEPPSLDTEVVLVDQITDSTFHSGGSIFFHPVDGFLYWCNGDDYRGPTQVINENLLSGIFRLDVDQRGGSVSHPIRRQPRRGSTANYFVPSSNPFVGIANVLEEFYALGLRNPYRMSIDAETRRLFIGDVGLFSREELNVIEPSDPPGLNFQWAIVEGAGGALLPPFTGVSKGPLLDYPRADGGCIIGGHVYRGAEFDDELGGKYIFGDNKSASIWVLDESSLPPRKVRLATFPLGPGPAVHPQYRGLSAFGLDHKGEILMCQLSTTGGRIYKLARRTATPRPQPFPQLLSETGAFDDVTTLKPSTNLIAYDVNSPLWSDGADKARWFTIPKSSVIGFSTFGEWQFPVGSVFVKHFEMPATGNLQSPPRRLETRVLARGTDGTVFGATYKWRSDNSDAVLLDGPLDEEFTFQTAAGMQTQIWHYPGPNECMQCHTAASQGVLGLNTRQLNRTFAFHGGISENQIAAYNSAGLLYPSPTLTNLASLPRLTHVTNSTESLELRARSYLDSNCSHCHRPGAGRTYWDARFETPLELSGILNGSVAQTFGMADARTIVPGHPEKSIILRRAGSLNPAEKMPPLGKSVVDLQAVEILSQYIASLPPATNALPAGWKNIDIGGLPVGTSASYSSDALNINPTDGDISGFSDAFSFVYQQLEGDGEITARIAATAGHEWARTGPMIRASLQPGSPHAHVCLANRQFLCFFHRSSANGPMSGPTIRKTAPVWVHLSRLGNRFTGRYSDNGTDWVELGSTVIDMPVRVYIGFASCGIDGLANFIIDKISIKNAPALNLPPVLDFTADVSASGTVAGPIWLRAAPTDPDGYPAMVEFFDGTTKLGQATSPPFELLAGVNSGERTFSARLYDNYGAVVSSSLEQIVVRPISLQLADRLVANSPIEITHLGNPGIAYIVEASDVLTDWQPISTNTTTITGTVQHSLPSESPYQFFRVRPR